MAKLPFASWVQPVLLQMKLTPSHVFNRMKLPLNSSEKLIATRNSQFEQSLLMSAKRVQEVFGLFE